MAVDLDPAAKSAPAFAQPFVIQVAFGRPSPGAWNQGACSPRVGFRKPVPTFAIML
jgi:hypothetical protein